MIRKTQLLYDKSDNVWTTNIEQILVVKLVANWAVARKFLHYVWDMQNIFEQLSND